MQDAAHHPLVKVERRADLLVGMPLQSHLNEPAVIRRLPLQEAVPLFLSDNRLHGLRLRTGQVVQLRGARADLRLPRDGYRPGWSFAGKPQRGPYSGPCRQGSSRVPADYRSGPDCPGRRRTTSRRFARNPRNRTSAAAAGAGHGEPLGGSYPHTRGPASTPPPRSRRGPGASGRRNGRPVLALERPPDNPLEGFATIPLRNMPTRSTQGASPRWTGP